MGRVCVTRRNKNARYLQSVAPHIIPQQEPAEGFTSLVPSHLLSRLSTLNEADAGEHAQLREFLRSTRVPQIGTLPVGPLFSGTLYLVQLTVSVIKGESSLPDHMIPDTDMATMLQYTQRAVRPISAYCSQYGVNSLAVSPNILGFNATITLKAHEPITNVGYTAFMLEGWLNTIVAKHGLPTDRSCLIVFNPPGLINLHATAISGELGYHSKASVPYCFCNVFGQNFTLDDRQDAYALQLSHEIAEMTVDPDADYSNPEVCDPCGPNCHQKAWRDYFSGTQHALITKNGFIQSTREFPPPFSYSFFINAIAKAAATSFLHCPPADPQTACGYAPPGGIEAPGGGPFAPSGT